MTTETKKTDKTETKKTETKTITVITTFPSHFKARFTKYGIVASNGILTVSGVRYAFTDDSVINLDTKEIKPVVKHGLNIQWLKSLGLNGGSTAKTITIEL